MRLLTKIICIFDSLKTITSKQHDNSITSSLRLLHQSLKTLEKLCCIGKRNGSNSDTNMKRCQIYIKRHLRHINLLCISVRVHIVLLHFGAMLVSQLLNRLWGLELKREKRKTEWRKTFSVTDRNFQKLDVIK